jgi:hypothetical protein
VASISYALFSTALYLVAIAVVLALVAMVAVVITILWGAVMFLPVLLNLAGLAIV